jgi:RNA polymerase sigma-70 factor (ECF subfamily)
MLYQHHSRLVYRRARELLADDAAAEDVTQEVFIRVMRAGGLVPVNPSPVAWLYRVATNLCLNRLRDQQRRAKLLAERHAGPADEPPCAELRAVVASILECVPRDLQETAVYFFVDEMTYDEIARLTGTSRRTVGNRLAAFRERAQAILSTAVFARVA